MSSIFEYLMYRLLSALSTSFKALKVGEVIDHAVAELIDNAADAISLSSRNRPLSDRFDKSAFGPNHPYSRRPSVPIAGWPHAAFKTRKEALDALNNIREMIDLYDFVTVADVYELMGKPISKTDSLLGWTTTKHVFIMHDAPRNRFIIKLPQPQPLEF